MSLRRVRDILPLVEGTNVGTDTLGLIRDEVRRLARAMPTEPVPLIFPDLAGLQDVLFRLLEGRQPPQQSRDLNFLTAATSALASGACFVLGNTDAAVAHSRIAYSCATNAGHPPLQAWIRGLQALHAYWSGQAESALHYTQLAGSAAVGTGTIAAWLPAVEARIHAATGDADNAIASLRRAEDARAVTVQDDLDEIGGDFFFPLPSQLYSAADAYSRLPESAAKTEQAAADAIAAYDAAPAEERSAENQSLSRTCLALARVRQNNIEGAQEALDPIFDLSSEYYVEPIRQTLGRVHGALITSTSAGSPVGRQLVVQTEQILRAPRVLPA
jgi:hypothetical protein